MRQRAAVKFRCPGEWLSIRLEIVFKVTNRSILRGSGVLQRYNQLSVSPFIRGTTLLTDCNKIYSQK